MGDKHVNEGLVIVGDLRVGCGGAIALMSNVKLCIAAREAGVPGDSSGGEDATSALLFWVACLCCSRAQSAESKRLIGVACAFVRIRRATSSDEGA